MISITSKSVYALSALVELAHHEGGDPIPVSELARRRQLPAQFLEQLFGALRRANIVASRRGVKGGYVLARPAARITALEVVQTLDGEIAEDQLSIPPWGEVVGELRNQLAERTLAMLADAERTGAGDAMYYI
ncbi:MAG: Rrf2 family transcriptional regulator [Thermoleophilia bacterium]|nr:Rrf2 family transcriptional regulator [Thermoleophilia bacterium]